MAEKIVSPGVFTNEIDASFLPAAVGEIGAAIIGPTVKGPALTPTVVTSFSQFESMFGTTFSSGSSYYQYLTSYAVREYLKNAGQVTVCRILAGDYSQAESAVSSSTTTTGDQIASASITLSQTPSGSDSFRIGNTDFIFISGTVGDPHHKTFLPNTGTQVYVPVNPTLNQFGNAGNALPDTKGHSASISLRNILRNADSASLIQGAGTFIGGTSAAIPPYGELGFVNLVSASAGTGPMTIGFTASKAGTVGNMTIVNNEVVANSFGTIVQFAGGTDDTTKTDSFILRTHGHGKILNSQDAGAAQNIANNVLVSGSENNIRWEVPVVNTKKGTFSLLIRRGDDTSKRKTILESYNNLSLDPNSNNYIAKIIGDQTQVVRDAATSEPFLQMSGSYPNKSNYVYVEVLSPTPNYLNNNGVITSDLLSASLPSVSSGAFYGGSDGTVQQADDGQGAGMKFYHQISENSSQGLDPSNNGGDGGYNQYITALNLLKNQDEFDINMLVLPGILNNVHGGIVEKAINVAEERGDCFVVADPVTYAAGISAATTEAEKYDSNYAAMYWPWIMIPDNQLGKNVWVPPSTVLPGVIAFNDKVAHPWFAPAGLNRGGIDIAVQAERKLSQSNRDTLYESNVNPIATFPGQGVVVFGQKTLQKKSSALDRVNVRRLMIKVKKFIASSSRFLVFEQNVEATRRRFLNIVNPYMEQVQSNSGVTAFRVVMDESNNTPDTIDRNILYGQIFLQPARTAEFIILDFTVQPTGATFDN